MKKFLIVFFSVLIAVICSISCFAVNYSTYSDLTANSTQVNNLLSLRSNSDVLRDYVCIRTEEEYILFISDNFDVVGDNISATNVTVIAYRNSGSSGNSSRYYSLDIPEVDIIKNHVVVSNFLDNSSKVNNTDWNKRIVIILCCILAVLVFWVIRRFK